MKVARRYGSEKEAMEEDRDEGRYRCRGDTFSPQKRASTRWETFKLVGARYSRPRTIIGVAVTGRKLGIIDLTCIYIVARKANPIVCVRGFQGVPRNSTSS